MLLRTTLLAGFAVGTAFVPSCVGDSPPMPKATASLSVAEDSTTPTFCYPVEGDFIGEAYCEARWIGCQNGWPIDYQVVPWPINPCPFPELGQECFCSFTDLEGPGDPQVCYDDYRACLVRIRRQPPVMPPP